MELEDFAERPISQLSGGQRQRAFIAMTICQDTDYMLLDEPLNNLDMRHASQTMTLIRRLAFDLDKTIVIVLHDINFAAYHADRIIAMKEGAVVADGSPTEIITAETMADIFDLELPVHYIAARPVVTYFAVGSSSLSELPKVPLPSTGSQG